MTKTGKKSILKLINTIVFSFVLLFMNNSFSKTNIADNNKQKFIIKVLLNLKENMIYNLGNEFNLNKIIVSTDGRKVAVIDHLNNLVLNSENTGRIYHASSIDKPLEHFNLDIKPWILHGSGESDYSIQIERAEAYAKDFAKSVEYTAKNINSKYQIDVDSYLKNNKNNRALKELLNVFNDSKIGEYKYDGTDDWANDEEKLKEFSSKTGEALFQYLSNISNK